MGHMIPINEITLKKLKFSFEVIPQRHHSSGIRVRFPQSDSEWGSELRSCEADSDYQIFTQNDPIKGSLKRSPSPIPSIGLRKGLRSCEAVNHTKWKLCPITGV